jgi:hypothetical protein
MTAESILINWVCETCDQPATDGVLHIDQRAALAARVEIDRWNEQRRSEGPTRFSVAAVFAAPRRVRWQVSCNGCAHDCGGCYTIELRQCRTWVAALCWQAHLYEKNWFNATNWVALLARVAREHAPAESAGVW